MTATVRERFFGVRDGECLPVWHEVGEVITGDLARVAVEHLDAADWLDAPPTAPADPVDPLDMEDGADAVGTDKDGGARNKPRGSRGSKAAPAD